MLTILLWRAALVRLENTHKMLAAFKAAAQSYRFYRPVGYFKPVACAVDSQVINVLVWCRVEFCLEYLVYIAF